MVNTLLITFKNLISNCFINKKGAIFCEKTFNLSQFTEQKGDLFFFTLKEYLEKKFANNVHALPPLLTLQKHPQKRAFVQNDTKTYHVHTPLWQMFFPRNKATHILEQ